MNRMQLWANELRTTDKKQARGWLRSKDGYCCLGIACELFTQETDEGLWVGSTFFAPNGESAEGIPPREVCEWFGMTDPHYYSMLNDAQKLTFEQIADKIERIVHE